ncbi:MAG: tetratricopeptide repeat protein [Candidatus Babeliales bacterium]
MEKTTILQSSSGKISSWLYWIIPPVVLSFLTGLFYYPSLNYNFQFDDVANIQKYFSIRHLTFDQAFFTSTRWIPFWLNAVNYRLGMFKPFYYRLFNISFHIIAGILVFYLIYSLLHLVKKDSFFKQYDFAIAFCTAALFMLHPVQTQTISYIIQGRLEGLAGLFVVAMSLCFLWLTQVTSSTTRALLTALLYVLTFFATGTKEIFIVAPLLLLMIDWFFVAQGDFADLKKRLLIHAGVALIIFVIFIHFYKPSFFTNLIGLKLEARNNIGNLLTEEPGQKIYPLHFFISQFKVMLHYIFMFFWPFTISVEYDWKLVTHFFAPDCILPLCVLLAIAAVTIYLLRKNRTNIIAFGILWFFVAVLPRSSIIPSSELLADYKTYLASVGILFVIACGIVKLITMVSPKIMALEPMLTHAQTQYAAIMLLALPMGFSTYDRNKVWRSSEEFWSNIIENAPGKARAYNNLAVALSEKGDLQGSIPLYKKAIQMDRNYPDPWNNLAVAYSMTNKLTLAIETLQQAIRIHPYYPEAYNNLASFFIQQKELEKAEKVLGIAVQLRPHYGKAYYNLGKIALERGNNELALEHFRTACTRCDLDNEAGFQVYANAAIAMKKYDEALFAMQKLLMFNPGSLDYVNKMANVLLLSKNYQEAAGYFKRLAQVQPSSGIHCYNLGECYMNLGQHDAALEQYEKAQRLNLNVPQLELRMIACLERVGRPTEAKDMLELFVKNEKMPASLREAAQGSLAQLKQKYPRLAA